MLQRRYFSIAYPDTHTQVTGDGVSRDIVYRRPAAAAFVNAAAAVNTCSVRAALAALRTVICRPADVQRRLGDFASGPLQRPP